MSSQIPILIRRQITANEVAFHHLPTCSGVRKKLKNWVSMFDFKLLLLPIYILCLLGDPLTATKTTVSVIGMYIKQIKDQSLHLQPYTTKTNR